MTFTEAVSWLAENPKGLVKLPWQPVSMGVDGVFMTGGKWNYRLVEAIIQQPSGRVLRSNENFPITTDAILSDEWTIALDSPIEGDTR